MKIKNIILTTTLAIGMILPAGTVATLNYSKKNKSLDNDLDSLYDLEDDELQVLVNKYNPLEDNYKPDDLEKPEIPFISTSINEEQQMREIACDAIKELFTKAKTEGINLLATSAYRSYDLQNNIYLSRLNTKGKEYADKYVALPGKSEHQTGLAIDVTNERRNFTKRSKEARWLEKNAYKYGFILRYPEGKEYITGIAYEPWHIRYVGKALAKNIHYKGITLEEYIKNKSYYSVRREAN